MLDRLYLVSGDNFITHYKGMPKKINELQFVLSEFNDAQIFFFFLRKETGASYGSYLLMSDCA